MKVLRQIVGVSVPRCWKRSSRLRSIPQRRCSTLVAHQVVEVGSGYFDSPKDMFEMLSLTGVVDSEAVYDNLSSGRCRAELRL